MGNVTKIKPARQKLQASSTPPVSLLLADPEDTPHRVACILKYLANHPIDPNIDNGTDEEYGLFLLLSDLAAALNHAQEVNHG